MTARLAVALIFTGLVMTGCGTTKQDRALSGGAIGAGVGGLAGAATGAPLGGALLGGAAGAAGGALTNPNQVDLGKPVWKR
jgi:hypothetical protein